MPDSSIRKLGGTCAILVGVSYLVFGITTLLDPSQSAAAGWQTLIQSPTLFLVGRWSIVIGALLALAMVPAVAQWLELTNIGWVNWLSKIAYLGFFVTALASVQAISINVLYASIDPSNFLVLGCVGLWVLGVNVLGLRSESWPKPLAYLGLAVALFYGIALAGNVFGVPILFTVAAGLGGVVLGPIWYIWLGRLLRG